LLHVAEEVERDAELQVQLLRVALAVREPLDERLGHIPQGAELGAALGQPGAELLNGAGVAILVLDQQRLEIDLGVGHRASLRENGYVGTPTIRFGGNSESRGYSVRSSPRRPAVLT